LKEYQEIRDTSPLGLKMLNDQLRLLWFRVKNTTTRDIRNGAVTLNKLASDVGQSLDLSSNESISLRISDIDIGGRNLARNTSNEYSNANHSTSYANIGTVVLSDVGLKPGDQITYSVYVKAHAEFGERLGIRWHNESDSNHANSYSEETLDPGAEGKLTLTAIIPNETVNFYLTLSAIPTGTVFTSQYKELKLERGNKATDWTPAPEDMVAKNNLVTEINLAPGTAKIQADKINLVGAVTVLSDITGNLGTITAGTINGIKINGTTITGGTIKVTGESSSLADLPFIVDRADGVSRFGIGGSRIMGECGGKITFQIANVFESGAILHLPNTNDDKLSITLNAPIGQVSADSFASRDVYIGDPSDPAYLCELRGDFDIEKIKTGTCNINTTTWKSFSFNVFMSPVPRVVLTSADGVSSISNGKVRNITNTGFEAILGGSGYDASTHHYIAISGEG
jgi:hypothetical protein